jgi:Putative capsular polysaccharide synthesis protein
MSSSFFLHRPDVENFVLVYTMGKVASMPLMRSLDAVGIYCRHLHWATADTQAFFERLEQVTPTGRSHWNFYVQNRLNMRQGRSALQDAEYASLIKVVTAIRAPIEQILSHYFQALPLFDSALTMKGLEVDAANIRDNVAAGVGHYMANPRRTIADLTRELDENNYDRIMFCWLVHNYLHWFDEEFRSFFHVDILGGQPNNGFQVASNALILKFEELPGHGAAAVAAYAQRPRFKLLRTNTGAQKTYGGLYRDVASTVKFAAGFVDHLCGSAYVRHFYSDEERREMCGRWIG